jgi:hypothetical protein
MYNMEEDLVATEEMIANVEFLSLFSDDSIKRLDANFDALFVNTEMIINSDNFDPINISVRPSYWKEVRTKRLLIKEYVDRLEGVMEENIIEGILKINCLFN